MNGLRVFVWVVLVIGGFVFWYMAGVRVGQPGPILSSILQYEVGEGALMVQNKTGHTIEDVVLVADRGHVDVGTNFPGHELFSTSSVESIPKPITMPPRLWKEIGSNG